VHQRRFLVPIVILSCALVSITSIVLVNAGPPATDLASLEAAQANDRLDESSAAVSATLPLFHRLSADYVRGAQPVRGGIGTLTRLGVKTIVDLRSHYDHTDEIGEAAERAGLGYYWLPTSVWDPPSDVEANRFISLVCDKSKGPFFVFCADGLNRTGEMSALYRVAVDKWSVEQALKEVDQLGFNPYYYTLRNYVWTYARKFRPEAVPPGARGLSPSELSTN
jgi:protein tyrosine/serine phosphatase